jgi:FixJ family two-component response regulator
MSAINATVFIVDDDADIRSSLSRALGKRGFEVVAFDSAGSFLNAYDPICSGCIVLDYGMPKMNGLELQEHLLKHGYAIPIIFITGHGGVPESVQAMKAGAIDFLEKPFRPEVLVERIKTAFDVDEKMRAIQEKALSARVKLKNLTARENEIVCMIVSNPANTASKEIGRSLDISPRTVDHHRARILEKTQCNSIVELVDLAICSELFAK